MRRTATGDSLRSFSIPIPRTNFGWSLRCGRIITRSPTIQIPTRSEIRSSGGGGGRVASVGKNYSQIPSDPNPASIGNQHLEAAGESPSFGLRDGDHETDGYIAF